MSSCLSYICGPLFKLQCSFSAQRYWTGTYIFIYQYVCEQKICKLYCVEGHSSLHLMSSVAFNCQESLRKV